MTFFGSPVMLIVANIKGESDGSGKEFLKRETRTKQKDKQIQRTRFTRRLILDEKRRTSAVVAAL